MSAPSAGDRHSRGQAYRNDKSTELLHQSSVQTITVKAYRCLRCLHTWLPRRSTRPVSCPACHSPYWDRPRRKETGRE